MPQRSLQRVEQSLADSLSLTFRSYGNPVDHRLDGVLLGLEKLDRFGPTQINDLPINSQTDKTLATSTVDHVTKLPGLVGHQGSQQHQACPFGPGKDLGTDLLG